jgi:copper homeostasis protein
VPQLLLEIASDGLGSALAAAAGGADRVELFASSAVGGTTPSAGTIAAARAALAIPLHVLIRPRAGDFLYSRAECAAMLHDIELCLRLGCEGVVIGALDTTGDVDVAICRELVAAAGSLAVTFNRAFDIARDQRAALEAIIELGCSRVLTSGGRASAHEGASVIAGLVRQGAERVTILAGAGITPAQVAPLIAATGVREIHASASASRPSVTHYRNAAVRGLDPDWRQTDSGLVRELAAALRACQGPVPDT